MVLYQLYSNLKALAKLKKNGKLESLDIKESGSRHFNQSGFKIISGKRLDRLYLSEIGNIPIKIHRKVEDKIKQMIIKHYNSGKWFALIGVEKEKNNHQKTNKVVGIDVGIRFFLTYSEGRYIENPRFYERTLKRIKIEQRRLSRKKKGSKNWEKQRRKLAKRYENMQASRTASRVIGPPILLDQPLTILPLLVTRQQIVQNPQQISSKLCSSQNIRLNFI